MPTLPHLQHALEQLPASQLLRSGEHGSMRLKVGAQGLAVGEAPFDPTIHDPESIDPLATWGLVTEEPYVSIVEPQYSFDINVVVDNSPSNDDPGIIATRRLLGRQLLRAVDESSVQTDHLHAYIIGSPEGLPYDYRTEFIKPDPGVKKLGEIGASGLTFVISDFNELALEQLDPRDMTTTVGIKVNHPFELSLPAGKGKWARGDGKPATNTNRPGPLQARNTELRQLHERTVQRMQRAGMTVAHVLFDESKVATLGIDIPQADRAITSALAARLGR